MRRLAALALFIALAIGLLAPAATRAQTGSPTPGTPAGFGIPLGTAVSYVGSDGAPLGTITVTTITDPFQGFDSSSAPPRGYHYALAEVTVTNTSSQPFAFDPSYIQAVDNDGFVAQQAYVTFTDPAVTQFAYTDALAPGASATGVIPYSLFGSSTIQRMAYNPTFDRLIPVLDLRAAPVAAGTPVSIMGTDGSERAQVTVNGVTAPFTGYDSASAPPRGSSYLALDVNVTNTGSGVLSVSPADFWVTDRDGFLLTSTYVGRTDTTVPDYTYLDLNPGESQHGVLIYPIFEGVPPAQVFYGDGYTSLNVVADLSAGMGAQTTTAPTAATATPTTAAGVPTIAATAAATTAAITSSPECEGVVEWGLDLVDRINLAGELTAPFQKEDLSGVDAAMVRDISAQVRTLADEQAASNPPAAAAELNTVMAEQFYRPLADTLDQIATALEQKNMAIALQGMQSAQALTTVFEDGGPYDVAADALTTACPEETNQLDQQAG